jgi:transcriptional regulator with XRE-family HTH domain
MRKSVHTRPYKVLQKHLVAARQEAGFTQQQLAQKLGRPQSFVAKYEGGERRLDIVELLSITELLGIDERHLFKALKNEL